MSTKNKKKQKPMPKRRNPIAEAARKQSGAGFMTNRNEKREKGRNSWRKKLAQLISGE